ncbi:CheR family methyltransferase [Petrotoga sp. DB-2]|jgi:chemotaxis protein methyltransferase CheR
MADYYSSPYDDEDYKLFLKKLVTHFNLDLSGYKQHRVRRRTDILLKKYGINSYSEYLELLQKNKDKWQEFLDKLTINVTEFFRNPEKWEYLKQEIIPELIKNHKPRLKFWSAGCSTGEEPYTLAIILNELGISSKSTIIASDFDDGALQQAKRGIYNEKSLINLNDEYIKKYFKKTEEGKYEIKDFIKNNVTFNKMNLLFDEFEKNFDLIICRNVVIYFDNDAKEKLYKKFYDALNPGGVLFVGSTERIFNHKAFGFTSIAPFFYKKII